MQFCLLDFRKSIIGLSIHIILKIVKRAFLSLFVLILLFCFFFVCGMIIFVYLVFYDENKEYKT
jgi:hypothetical protein